MNYLFIACGVIVGGGGLALSKVKCSDVKYGKVLKVVACVTFALFALRVISYFSKLDGYTLVPKNFADYKYPTSGKFSAITAFLLEWLSLSAVTLTTLKPFFKIKTLDRLVLFFVPFYLILSCVFINNWQTVSLGSEDAIISRILFGLETGSVIALIVFYWVDAIIGKQIPLFKNWKSVLFFAIALILAIAVALPNYTWTFLFGAAARRAVNAKGFASTHRMLIYGAVIIPLVAYFILKKFDRTTSKCILLYFGIVSAAVYCYYTTLKMFIESPQGLPFHLCNTAMFLIPLCLTFKMNKLFYFTYFINVFGALIAMLMPNYGDKQFINDSGMIRFWYNHYCAFFMPLLLVALKQFERPTVKQFKYSIVGFCMYFVFALVTNVVLNGFGYDADYFFLYGSHISDTLGKWAKRIYDVDFVMALGGREFVLRPLYQTIFFVVYVGLGLAMWFVYELGFTTAEALGDLSARNKKIKLDHYALMSALNGRDISEPMNRDAGIKLELKHFSKRYGTSKGYAVNDANLEVFGGEIFGFLGPNGAGKSTIIKSIVGIQPITEGSIEVCGFDCEKQPVQAKSIIGYVPDHYALYEKLTGREYINYIADIYNVSQEDRTRRIERHIEMFELQGSIDNPIKTYSHGMKQKITIMAALVHNPKLWILDEPLTGLDPNSIHQVKECMKEHASKGNIVFFSSHIIDVVERICDRITIIKKGKILVTRNVADLEKEGALEDFYLKTINGGEVNG